MMSASSGTSDLHDQAVAIALLVLDAEVIDDRPLPVRAHTSLLADTVDV